MRAVLAAMDAATCLLAHFAAPVNSDAVVGGAQSRWSSGSHDLRMKLGG